MGETMKTEELQRLLAEYAAGSIGDKDRQTLMAAALQDQALFEALAAEQPLADLMADSASRAELRAALRKQRSSHFSAWFWKPWPATALATVMIACAVFIVTQYLPQTPLPTDYRLTAQKEKAPVPGASPDEKAQVAEQIVAQKKDVPTSYASPAAKIQAADRLAALQEQAPVPNTLPADKIKSTEQIAAQKENAAVPAASPAGKTQVAERAAGGIVGGVVGGVVGGIIAPKDFEKDRPSPPQPAIVDKDEAQSLVRMESRLAAASTPPLICRLLRRSTGGQFQEVTLDTQFVSGDAARIILEPQASGYLAVAELAENNAWRLIFPPQRDTASRVPPQSSITLPAGEGWEFGSPPRERRLLAVLTTQPQAVLVAADGSLVRPQDGTILEIILRVSP